MLNLYGQIYVYIKTKRSTTNCTFEHMNCLKVLLSVGFSVFISFVQSSANNISDSDTICASTIDRSNSLMVISIPDSPEVKILTIHDSAKTSKYKSKKRIAAILSFPFPFGLLGLHRVFLGTKPYIPFVYIGTLGGCFLILPIIDFISILSSNERSFQRFENNSRVFMWAH